ncbi:MAG: hypothetical protein IPL32_04450 [Chloracidobacterium sp.]|nr:hypothetical protein [Chloracidobacterium sp.]
MIGRIIFFTTSLVLFHVCIVSAQTKAQTVILADIIGANDSGELTSALLDRLALTAKETGARIFVISRGGLNDKDSVVQARLAFVKSYRAGGLAQPQNLFAVGERVAGEGRIEFYVGSDLRLVVLAKPNRIPNLTCCDDFVPPTKKSTKKRSKG